MKIITISTILFAFCFATGFTCSKNSPPAESTSATPSTTESVSPASNGADATSQVQMEAAPTTAQPAQESAPATTETK
ncbi:MAG: acylneuraminate cytidylyltransferase [Pseudobdellovibrio sp.]